MKLEGRRTSRLHLQFDPVTEVCWCGCGLAYMDARRRNREIRFLHEPEANSIALRRLMEKGKVTLDVPYGIEFWVKPKEQE